MLCITPPAADRPRTAMTTSGWKNMSPTAHHHADCAASAQPSGAEIARTCSAGKGHRQEPRHAELLRGPPPRTRPPADRGPDAQTPVEFGAQRSKNERCGSRKNRQRAIGARDLPNVACAPSWLLTGRRWSKGCCRRRGGRTSTSDSSQVTSGRAVSVCGQIGDSTIASGWASGSVRRPPGCRRSGRSASR